ncbi:glycosyltransferase [Micrococcoides hystricis]|uniref:D-inositol 3-phosphate glycosyltransferase n=1 Tax=Micrococcoides hystricis TaxID=1572761 RepID=A0ABV6P8R7_9MICC
MSLRKDDKLTILIAADTYPPDVNGAAMFCYRLATAMTARGHEVHVVAARNDAGPGLKQFHEEATIHRLRSHKAPTHESYRLCFPWQIKKDMAQVFAEIQPDVVHAQCHYMVGEAAINEAVRRRVRLIATNHFMPENLEPYLPFPRWFLDIVSKNSWRDMGKLMGQAQVVTTPTPLAAKTMAARAGLKHVLPLSNGIDYHHYEAKAEDEVVSDGPARILFVGRLAVEKNIDVLLHAAARLRGDFQVRIVGDGDQRDKLHELAHELKLGEKVQFLGHVDDDQLRQEYLDATVFCQPGTAELQSLVSLEAMSASTPVVLANALALPHLINQEKTNGYLFVPGDPEDLAAKLQMVLDAPEAERRAMGQASHELAMTHSVDTIMDKFEALYRGSDGREFMAPGTANPR